ncbi:type 3 dihydrofolate reductase [Candidatus Woesearchaeota archaeon]|nr:type 3 dihydrofolate reductase [Candidatus Woesearchaeota archaeon]
MIISLIAAMGKNNVIGKDNSLPWKLPADMKRFKELTTGKPVIMGRKTFESIGKPLPNRKNIVITRDKDYRAKGCIVVHSADSALKAATKAEEVMVIGGEQIFKEFLPKANKMYLTFIYKDFDGDAYFPEYDKSEWKEIKREEYKNENYKFVFVILQKID